MVEQLSKEILAFESDHIWVHENFDDLLKDYQDRWIDKFQVSIIASAFVVNGTGKFQVSRFTY